MDEAALAILKAELDAHERDLNLVFERIQQREARFRDTIEGIDSMAYQLHNLYNAFEQLFETAARFFENQVGGDRYHTALLRRMTLEIEGIRPALISDKTFDGLDELRRFRHFFRHAYTADLNPEKLEALVSTARELRDPFRRDKETFLDQLVP